MDFSFLFYVFFVILVILFFSFRSWLAKREEDYYYNRLYWTMRQAQEDAERYKKDDDKSKND